MTGLLTAIDGELDAAERRVEQLRQMRALALSLDGAGEGVVPGALSPPAVGGAPPRAAKRSPTPKPAPPADQTTPIERSLGARHAIIKALQALGDATQEQVSEKASVHIETVKTHLRRMMDDGVVVISGRAPGAYAGGRPVRLYALKLEADQRVAALGTGRNGAALAGLGTINGERRNAVLACIAEGDGLGEPEIAAQLGIDREHVAEATGALLEAGRVQLAPDGTYTATTKR